MELFTPQNITLAVLLMIGGALLSFLKHMHKTNVQARNIRRHGWPPPHVDALGNFKPGPADEDDDEDEEDEDDE